MEIRIEHLLDGAKKSEGLVVIIDVFRAFSVECYGYDRGAKEIIPVKEVEEAFNYKKLNPSVILAGERNGIKVEGFDFSNSPSELLNIDLNNKTIIHTTSSGVQGISNAIHAEEIITGSLVNAKAIARYIKERKPKIVSLVAMGWCGDTITEEDEICAKYIKSLLEDNEIDISKDIEALKKSDGARFFNEDTQHIFPKDDFYLCTKLNIFDFIIKVIKKDNKYRTERIYI